MPTFRWLFDRLSALCAAVAIVSLAFAIGTEFFPHEPTLNSPPLPIGTTRVTSFAAGRLRVRDVTCAAFGPYVRVTEVDVLHVAFGPVAAACAVLPALWVMDRWAGGGNVYRPGQCQTCGYDLRASRERCPECGTPRPRRA